MKRTRAEPEKKSKDIGIRECAATSIRAMEGEGNERKFVLSFSSEEPYNRWYGTEILEHTEQSVVLDRLNEIGVVLFNHNRDEVLGKVNRAWVEGKRGCAEIEFDSDERSEWAYQKVKNNTLKTTSVGYSVSSWEEVKAGETSKDGRFTGPVSIAAKWTPLEISIVSVPADATVGVGRGMEETQEDNHLQLMERQIQINQNH